MVFLMVFGLCWWKEEQGDGGGVGGTRVWQGCGGTTEAGTCEVPAWKGAWDPG